MPLHPIVRRMAPSPEQEPAILARGRDVVVTAGAGAGKTRTLVARYLSLLAEGLPLRSVVAITFTEKAAHEMRNRVREQIRQYLADIAASESAPVPSPASPGAQGEKEERSPDPAEEAERWEALYQELDAARIATIHGLCAEILRAHPAEARLDPRFDVLDEARARLLLGEAIDEALAWATEDAEGAALFALLGERGLRDALDTLLAGRLEARTAWDVMPPDAEGCARFWRSALAGRQARAWAALQARPEWAGAVSTLESTVAVNGADLMEIARQSALAALRGADGKPLPEALASLAGLDAIKLTGGAAKNWPAGKDQVDQVKAALRILRTLWQGNMVLALRWSALDDTLAAGMPALRRAWEFALARYEDAKRGRNVVDFDDLEAGALALLRDHASVRDRWAREVGALLVDEFQDTNARQRDLVALLNHDAGAAAGREFPRTGGKLFVVGDAKQSIYAFRGADVTVFRAERGRAAAAGGQVCALDTSYRAHHRLIEGLNDLLRPVLGKAADPERPWVEPFAALRPYDGRQPARLPSPFIELLLTVGTKGEGALERAARATASRLDALVKASSVAEPDVTKRLNYGDVAVLCRASGSFAPYEDAFDAAGIPYLTVAGRGFYDRPEVRDLLNALRALADPTDDLALVGLLRSPAIGLSDAALYVLCRDKGSAACLWDYIAPSTAAAVAAPLVGAVSAADGGSAHQGRGYDPSVTALIARLHGLVGRTPVADVLKAFLDSTCYRAALLHAGQSRAARNVGKLLADAHASGIVGVGEFLEYVAGLRDAGAREGEARSDAEGAVQIMSVHAAKGLEFPVVVIGDAAHRRVNHTPVLPDPDLGVLLPTKAEDAGNGASPARTCGALYALGRTRADDQEEAESDRLFYVAATRAQEMLILSAQVTVNKDGGVDAPGGWLGRIAGPDALGLAGFHPADYADEGADVRCYDLTVGATPVVCRFYEPHCPPADRRGGPMWPPDPPPADPTGSHTGLPLPADSASPAPADPTRSHTGLPLPADSASPAPADPTRSHTGLPLPVESVPAPADPTHSHGGLPLPADSASPAPADPTRSHTGLPLPVESVPAPADPTGSHTGLPLPADSAAPAPADPTRSHTGLPLPADSAAPAPADPTSSHTGLPLPADPNGHRRGGPPSDPVCCGTEWPPETPDSALAGSHGGLPLLDPVAAGPDEPAPEPRPGQRVWQVTPTGQGRATAPAWVVGQLVHAALAEWRLPGGPAPDPDFERRTEVRARGYGLIDRERLQDAVRETRLLLERFRRHALFSEMDTADRRLHEIPYDLLDGSEGDGTPEHGIMDALYWHDGGWTVVDFKTDDLRGEADWDRVRPGYDRQAERYMAAAERLLGQPPRFKFCLLNFQRRVEVRAAGDNKTAPLPS